MENVGISVARGLLEQDLFAFLELFLALFRGHIFPEHQLAISSTSDEALLVLGHAQRPYLVRMLVESAHTFICFDVPELDETIGSARNHLGSVVDEVNFEHGRVVAFKCL